MCAKKSLKGPAVQDVKNPPWSSNETTKRRRRRTRKKEKEEIEEGKRGKFDSITFPNMEDCDCDLFCSPTPLVSRFPVTLFSAVSVPCLVCYLWCQTRKVEEKLPRIQSCSSAPRAGTCIET